MLVCSISQESLCLGWQVWKGGLYAVFFKHFSASMEPRELTTCRSNLHKVSSGISMGRVEGVIPA